MNRVYYVLVLGFIWSAASTISGCSNNEQSISSPKSESPQVINPPPSLTVHDLLAEYPSNVISIKTLDEPNVRIIEVQDQTTGGMKKVSRVKFKAMVRVDQEKYDEFITKLIPLLEEKATANGEAFAEGGGLGALPEPFRAFYNSQENWFDKQNSTVTLEKPCYLPEKFFQTDCGGSEPDPELDMIMVVNTASFGQDKRTEWKWFQLEKNEFDSGIDGIKINVTSPEGKPIDRTILKWDGINFTPGIEVDQRMPQEPQFLVVSPFAIDRLHQSFRDVVIEHTMDIDTTGPFNLSFEPIAN